MNKSPTGCRADQLFGFWFMDPAALESYREHAVAMDLEWLARSNAEAEAKEKEAPPPPYVNENGVAVINVSGPTAKYPTSFQRLLGGTSTMMVEKAMMDAQVDPAIKSVLLHMDSAPGGTVAGAFELVDRIRKVKAAGKPVFAHGSDQMTSAGYLFGAACDRITANRNCVVGSIGVRAHLVDTSQKMEKAGIKVIPIASGKYKAAGLPGTPVTDEQIAEFQREINGLNEEFVADVSKGRGLHPQTIKAMEARCYVGAEAQAKGLIDGICSYEQALGAIQQANSEARDGGGIVAALRKTNAAPQLKRSLQMQLLTEVRTLFGAADMTEEQAIESVRSLKAKADKPPTGIPQATHDAAVADRDRFKQELAAAVAKLPREADPEMLKDRADLVIGRIDLALARHDFPTAIADKFKKAVIRDGKPVPFMLTSAPDLGNMRPIDFMLGMFDGANLAPPTGSQTHPVTRHVLGSEDSEDAEAVKASADKAVADYKLSRGLKD